MVETGDHHLGDVGDEQLSFDAIRRSCWNRQSCDLGLPTPFTLLAWHRVESRTVEGEPRITMQIGPFAGSRHGPKCQLALGELALDARDPGRPVGTNRGNGLVTTGIKKVSHAFGKIPVQHPRIRPRWSRDEATSDLVKAT